ncbi:MAG TPA: hypothetical protein VFI19_01405, partial [Nocardioides sp.]|nr:hypothetical protein [Nocardioides sp.]
MGSHQLDPRTKEEVRRLGPGLPPGMPGAEYYGVQQSAWVVWVNFAGVLLIMLGAFHVIQGLVALFRDEVYVVRSSGLIINVDYTTWGWVHLALGAVAILAGVCLLAGQMWARIVAVIVAFLSAINAVSFIQAEPVWSVIVIALDVIIIWAVVVHG